MKHSFRPLRDTIDSHPSPVTVEARHNGVEFELPERTFVIDWEDWETLIVAVKRPPNDHP